LLQAFHQAELRGLKKYLAVRRSLPTELLGYQWPVQLIHDVLGLNLNQRWADQLSKAKRQWIVSSKADESIQLRNVFHGDWRFCNIRDEILWNNLNYINAAIASPSLYRCVLDLLGGLDHPEY
jgi:hypothetical protein